MNGKPPLKFGTYEFRKTFFDWKSLLFAVVLAICGWATTEFIPALQDEGGGMAAIGAILAVAVRAVVEWIRDNSTKQLPAKK